MLLDALRKNNIILYGSGRVKNDIRKIRLKELKGSDRLWIRPILKDEKNNIFPMDPAA